MIFTCTFAILFYLFICPFLIVFNLSGSQCYVQFTLARSDWAPTGCVNCTEAGFNWCMIISLFFLTKVAAAGLTLAYFWSNYWCNRSGWSSECSLGVSRKGVRGWGEGIREWWWEGLHSCFEYVDELMYRYQYNILYRLPYILVAFCSSCTICAKPKTCNH